MDLWRLTGCSGPILTAWVQFWKCEHQRALPYLSTDVLLKLHIKIWYRLSLALQTCRKLQTAVTLKISLWVACWFSKHHWLEIKRIFYTWSGLWLSNRISDKLKKTWFLQNRTYFIEYLLLNNVTPLLYRLFSCLFLTYFCHFLIDKIGPIRTPRPKTKGVLLTQLHELDTKIVTNLNQGDSGQRLGHWKTN